MNCKQEDGKCTAGETPVERDIIELHYDWNNPAVHGAVNASDTIGDSGNGGDISGDGSDGSDGDDDDYHDDDDDNDDNDDDNNDDSSDIGNDEDFADLPPP